ncbi:hypothetical protein L1766_05065 [Thermovorax subterraneus]|nr:hypothetical protein [Thermovorax subterraneus]
MDGLVRIFESAIAHAISGSSLEFVGNIFTVGDLVTNTMMLKDKIFANKLKRFILRVRESDITKKDIEQFNKKHLTNLEKKKELVRIVIDMIDKEISNSQVDVIAALTVSYIKEKITFEQFISLMFALKMFNPSAYSSLKKLGETNFSYNGPLYENEAMLIAAGLASRHGNLLRVNDLGKDLYEYGIKPYFDNNNEDNNDEH